MFERLINVISYPEGTFNDRPWRECIDELTDLDIQWFEEAERQIKRWGRLLPYKNRLHGWLWNKRYGLRTLLSVRKEQRPLRRVEKLIFGLNALGIGRYDEDENEYGSEIVLRLPLGVELHAHHSHVIDHAGASISRSGKLYHYCEEVE